MMRKFFFLILIMFTCSIGAMAKCYYVSNTGNDSNNGLTPDRPFLTLQKINSLKIEPGDSILFRRNNVFLGTLFISHSGTESMPVFIGAYGNGDAPVFTGARVLDNFQKYENDIYRTHVNKKVFQLYINDELYLPARYPNHGFLTIDKGSKTSLTDKALISAPFDLTGSRLRIRAVAWQYETNRVSEHKKMNIKFETPMQYKASKGYGYFLDNKYEFIDMTGEWYYDDEQQMLYSKLPENNQKKIAATTIDFGIIIDKGGKHIIINGINIEKYGVAAILGNEFSSDIKIEGCTIQSCGIYGINLSPGTRNYHIENNDINNVLGRGISTLESSHLLIRYNTVRNTGLIPGYGFDGVNNGIGIAILRKEKSFSLNQSILEELKKMKWSKSVYDSLKTIVNLPFPDEKFMLETLAQKITVNNHTRINDKVVGLVKKEFESNNLKSEYNSIIYNTIDSSGYCAIRLDGTYSSASYNVVSNSILNMNDGGAIYCWAQNDKYTHNNVIRGNIVRNSTGSSIGTPANSVYANGIYIDNKCHHILVEANTVTHTVCGILINDESYKNKVVGNTTYDNQYGLVFSEYFKPGSLHGCVAKNNLLFGKKYDQRALFIESRISNQFSPVILEKNTYGSASYIYPVTTLTYSAGIRHFKDFGKEAWENHYAKESASTYAVPEKLENSFLMSQIIVNETADTLLHQMDDDIMYKDVWKEPLENNIEIPPYSSKIIILEP